MPTEMELRGRNRAGLEQTNNPASIDPKYFDLSGQPGAMADRRNEGVLGLLQALYGEPWRQLIIDMQHPFDVPERFKTPPPVPETTSDPLANKLGYGSIGRK